MANTLTTQTIIDGCRNAVVKVTSVQTTSDLASVTVITPSSLAFAPKGVRVAYLDYSISDQLNVQILWNGSTDQIMMPLAGRGRMDFTSFGGLTDNDVTGSTGNIDVLTTGWASGTQVFTLVFEMEKVTQDGVGVK